MEDVDDLEFEAARTGDHPAAAERLERLAEASCGVAEAGAAGDAAAVPAVSRAEILVRAGAQWQLAGDPARAAEQYRRAVDDGGRASLDPRACLVDALFDLGRHEQAWQLIARIRAEGPTNPEVYNFLAETLEAQRDLGGAHDWATAGLDLVLRAERRPNGLFDSLLRTRYRVRREMRLPEDEHDRTLDAILDREDSAGDRGGTRPPR